MRCSTFLQHCTTLLWKGLLTRQIEHDDCLSGDVRFQHWIPLDHLGGLVFCLFVLTATDQSAYRTRPAMSPPKAKCMTGQGTAPLPFLPSACGALLLLFLPQPASPLAHFYSLQLSVSSCCAILGFGLSHLYVLALLCSPSRVLCRSTVCVLCVAG